jgi:hypothetical protein
VSNTRNPCLLLLFDSSCAHYCKLETNFLPAGVHWWLPQMTCTASSFTMPRFVLDLHLSPHLVTPKSKSQVVVLSPITITLAKEAALCKEE